MPELHNTIATGPQVWRIHLKSAAQGGFDPGEFCISNQIVGIGWRVEPDVDEMPWDAYFQLAKEEYGAGNGWWAAINAVRNRMAIGDLCWARTRSGKYWLGKIEGDWSYRNSEQHRLAGVVNVRKCRWIEVGDLHQIPGKVINAFRATRTVQMVPNEAVRVFSMVTYNSLTSENHYAIPDKPGDLFSMLCPEDCADLVGVYLQTKGYVLFPGTCKSDTKQFEFVLRHRESGQYAAVQVKQGWDTLNPSDYSDFNGDVLLFQTGDRYVGTPQPNVRCLSRDEMESFCFGNLNLLTARIQRWVNITTEQASR